MPDTVPPEIIDLARHIACEHALDPALVCAVIEQESAWNPWAVRYEPGFLSRYVAPLYTAGKLSATEAYTRAMSWGLMQVMGQVAREFGFKEASLAELCDPATGIDFGCRILAARLARAKGDVPAALLAWNGGADAQLPRRSPGPQAQLFLQVAQALLPVRFSRSQQVGDATDRGNAQPGVAVLPKFPVIRLFFAAC